MFYAIDKQSQIILSGSGSLQVSWHSDKKICLYEKYTVFTESKSSYKWYRSTVPYDPFIESMLSFGENFTMILSKINYPPM